MTHPILSKLEAICEDADQELLAGIRNVVLHHDPLFRQMESQRLALDQRQQQIEARESRTATLATLQTEIELIKQEFDGQITERLDFDFSRGLDFVRPFTPGVYILECHDGALYTGSAGCIGARLREHVQNVGSVFVMAHGGFKKLLQVVYTTTRRDAFALETTISHMVWSKYHKERAVYTVGSPPLTPSTRAHSSNTLEEKPND
jgi:predicted GIY-YIG superfamily endonuclease